MPRTTQARYACGDFSMKMVNSPSCSDSRSPSVPLVKQSRTKSWMAVNMAETMSRVLRFPGFKGGVREGYAGVAVDKKTCSTL